MKFHLLKTGDRFIYRGEVYFKSTPLVAINEISGNSRLIPRSALLQLMEGANSENNSKSEPDNNIQETLRQSAREFVTGLGDIIVLAEQDRLAIQKLYEDVSARLIKNTSSIQV